MRDEFITSLIKYNNNNLVVLDGDCARSTKSRLYKYKFPDQFYNIGIAEQNLIGVSSGLAREGFVPVVNAFAAMLVSRALDQIIQSICLPNLQVLLAGHYSGISASLEGAPHHGIFDLAFLRPLPNMSIYTPSTSKDIELSVNEMLASKHPSYIRLSRNPIKTIKENPVIHTSEINLYGPTRGKVLFMAHGESVHECLKARDILYSEGIESSVLSVVRLKPFNCADLIRTMEFESIITVEEHSVLGGLGSIVCEQLSQANYKGKITCKGLSGFTETGDYDWLLAKYGLDANGLYCAVKETLLS